MVRLFFCDTPQRRRFSEQLERRSGSMESGVGAEIAHRLGQLRVTVPGGAMPVAALEEVGSARWLSIRLICMVH
ncbi:hypothetical protein KDA_52220 [Dictyobacter alpinus]|uniref:Uncharacterized protein n=1 Tax=Dictyobacter alpinus TaxID=2014873 RepID=A0A402BEB3_9CHLR|nr:hypothetical protein [Dictyobacter alpinus]GCE29738.1 hypothetical protein KDA_52220 [Dictyobacter alpinus]